MLFPGFELKPFAKAGHPSPFSQDDINLLVQVLNAFLRMQIKRGKVDAVFISDHNVILQIGAIGIGGTGIPEGSTVDISDCVTGRTWRVIGMEIFPEEE